MAILASFAHFSIEALNRVGEFLPQLGLRLLLAYEFWEAGITKYRGENWFADVQDRFLFPWSR
ncbi:hypothetical protein Nhal_0866 [Nitrosococcus halophilus Nc 4]|uniref:Uncharacterized protein n=1 Tax=Nitrosococcus halophilus (strain Nc4) TaxID=472759 RepID=D5BY59_NITHN|nr:hypothetical protein [Nitrosococcus halophilus]ADE14042.1 hypothetical protein Nhal_0866 [Nitrosococcus halophilus Nc 4]